MCVCFFLLLLLQGNIYCNQLTHYITQLQLSGLSVFHIHSSYLASWLICCSDIHFHEHSYTLRTIDRCSIGIQNMDTWHDLVFCFFRQLWLVRSFSGDLCKKEKDAHWLTFAPLHSSRHYYKKTPRTACLELSVGISLCVIDMAGIAELRFHSCRCYYQMPRFPFLFSFC